ncbi:response regulator [Spirosoma spitsbergense]|uniref:response regulator n=1 Tax=Spirosoma spitsbergense TaxID=431554 RepID=UPI000373562A|nr:response regulator [Spirosoma spitsbergense]
MKNFSNPACVLIVDDDEDDRWLMTQAFERACPQIQQVLACDGEEAFDYLQIVPVPLFIITDLNMPRMNGVELVEQLRFQPRYQSVPVIVCTTSASPNDRCRCYAAGANAFITKPNCLTDLTELIRCLVRVWDH